MKCYGCGTELGTADTSASALCGKCIQERAAPVWTVTRGEPIADGAAQAITLLVAAVNRLAAAMEDKA